MSARFNLTLSAEEVNAIRACIQETIFLTPSRESRDRWRELLDTFNRKVSQGLQEEKED